MLSYSPLTLSSDRLFFDEETKKFFDRVTGDEVSGWKLADGYTVYAQINKGGSCFAYRGLHEGRFIIVKELIPASFCPFLTRREDGFIVLQDGMSYSHSYLSKIKEEVNNAYQREIDMSHRLRYKGSNNNPRFFSVNEIPISNGSLAKYLAIDTSAGDTLDTYVLSRPQYQPNSPECDIIACLKLAKEVAYAIGEIHAKGFLHLDVKPSNLFRSELTYMQDGASLIHPIDMGSAAACCLMATLMKTLYRMVLRRNMLLSNCTMRFVRIAHAGGKHMPAESQKQLILIQFAKCYLSGCRQKTRVLSPSH